MTTLRLRVFVDYGLWPLWPDRADGSSDNVDPAEFGLSADLASALAVWSDDYDSLFDPDDYTRAPFATHEDRAAFDDRGLALARRVADEVRDAYWVSYGRVSEDTWLRID